MKIKILFKNQNSRKKIDFFVKSQNFGQKSTLLVNNQNFGHKSKFCSQIQILVLNPKFGKKNPNFCHKTLLVKKLGFWLKKNRNFVQNQNFGRENETLC